MHAPRMIPRCVIVLLALSELSRATATPVLVVVNGVDLGTAALGRVINGQVMIPLRAVALGADVKWD